MLEHRLNSLDTSDLIVINNAIEEFSGDVSIDNYNLAKAEIHRTIEKCALPQLYRCILTL